MLVAKSNTTPASPPTPRQPAANSNSTSRCRALSVCCFAFILAAGLSIFVHLTTATSVQLGKHDDDLTLEENYKNGTNGRESLVAVVTAATPQPNNLVPSASASNNNAKTLQVINGSPTNSSDDSSPTVATDVAIGTSDSSSSADNDEGINNNSTIIIDYDRHGYDYQAATSSSTTNAPSDTTPAVLVQSPATISSAIISAAVGQSTATASKPQSASLVVDQPSSSTPPSTPLSTNAESETVRSADQDADSEELAKSLSGAEKLRAPGELRDLNLRESVQAVNTSGVFNFLFKKKPYSKFWSVEQKWDDVFKRFVAIQGAMRKMFVQNMMKNVEYYADVTISHACAEDLKFIQNYVKKSTNFRWLMHMLDATGKSQPGMLTGNMAQLGHVVQCIKVRAPGRPSNETFDERYFDQQTELLGERFRGKYCLASIRPVLPAKPRLVSRFSHILDNSLVSNISYMGEPNNVLRRRLLETLVPKSVLESIDRERHRLDQVPFESELYQYLIAQQAFMFALPQFSGVCYPSSCTKEDVRLSLQKTFDDQHQVVDIEYECEVEERSAWSWFTTPRLIACVLFYLVVAISFTASVARYILVDKMGLKKSRVQSTTTSQFVSLLDSLDMLSMDKCAGALFVKTRRASPIVDETKIENARSTTIDALKGLLILILVYSQLVYLGCLPVPFMWSKWGDTMFPFYRSLWTQPFLNAPIWTEAFYMISAYLIGAKLLENHRPSADGWRNKSAQQRRVPDFLSYALNRYVRLAVPMVAFILMNYVWPRLSNGFVMQDQASKILAPCDNYGWTNMLMFHNHHLLNETCLWPTHVSASFFQLHLISYPILLLFLFALRTKIEAIGTRKLIHSLLSLSGWSVAGLLAIVGLLYPAYQASNQELVVPFLIDYIDFDNYQRVIEWTVLPTINHLTSYVIGIVLAYLVVEGRAQREAEAKEAAASALADGSASSEAGDWRSFSYMKRDEGSLESVLSSSTQELGSCTSRPAFKITLGSEKFEHPADSGFKGSGRITTTAAAAATRQTGGGGGETASSWLASTLTSAVAFLLIYLACTASWLWNGLGQPMSPSQTFWYMCTTKLVFNLAFAYLFLKHAARRQNSTNPWIITRFLVPIGRMGVMVFYVSWLVIWFDLLSSLYQWHPSHYFVFEKYNEIIFLTLVVAIFAYGSFEGPIKLIGYAKKRDRLVSQQEAPKTTTGRSAAGARREEPFDSFFSPTPNEADCAELVAGGATDKLATTTIITGNNYKEAAADGKVVLDNSMAFSKSSTGLQHHPNPRAANLADQARPSSGAGGRHLSIADQYKLNAELRANYSFASIGLYESAGATGDLPLQQQQQQSPRDPQAVQERNGTPL